MLILGLAVRFIHFALFDGTLLSLHYYAVDTAILHDLRLPGLPHYARAGRWPRNIAGSIERTGPFSWRPARQADT